MTINEIAKMSGVSRATVSRFLNNGYVSQEKKEKIQKVIDETGYQPSTYAQTLRSKKTNYIGVIIPKIDSASIARTVKGISKILSEFGYQLLLGCTDNDEKEELKYLNLFKENHVDGIILLGTILTKEHYKLLEKTSVPVVILGQYVEKYSCIYHDDYGASKTITDQLCHSATNWGHICVTQSDKAVGYQRTQGMLDSLKEHNISIPSDCIIESHFTVEAGYEAAKKLLSINPKIDTLLCSTDTIAIGAIKYIHEINLEIPNDIQIIGFGDSTISQITTPSLTTVHFHYKTAGIEATKMLLEMINSPNEKLLKQLKLGYKIIQNNSTR